jgi:hypothetical protein
VEPVRDTLAWVASIFGRRLGLYIDNQKLD